MSEFSERWTPDLVMECLEYYYRFSCLWDVDSIDYKNKQKKEQAINEMATYFHMSTLMMKKKIHSLRNAYINEVSKINKSIECGETVYVPKLSWYKFADSFLGKVIRRKKSDFKSALSQISWRMSKENVPSSHSNKEKEITREPEIDLSVGSSSPPLHTTTYTNKETTKRQKLDNGPSALATDSLLQEAVNAVKNLSSSLMADKNDEIIAFGQSVIAQLGKLPEEYQIECMSEIQSVITLTRLKYLKSRQPNTFLKSEMDSQ